LLRRRIQIAEFAILMDEDNGGSVSVSAKTSFQSRARARVGAPAIGDLQSVADGRHQAVEPVLEI